MICTSLRHIAAFLIVLFALSINTAASAQPEGAWTKATPAPTARTEVAVAALEGELVALRARTAASGAKATGPDREPARQRAGLLESENQLLRQRIAVAREQVERLQTRLRFIEDRGGGE